MQNTRTSKYGIKQKVKLTSVQVPEAECFVFPFLTRWKYTPADSFTPWYFGNMGLYSSGGYLFTLPKSRQESMEKLASLKQNNWLTRGTRVVFIDFSTYNANLNLFCVVR